MNIPPELIKIILSYLPICKHCGALQDDFYSSERDYNGKRLSYTCVNYYCSSNYWIKKEDHSHKLYFSFNN